MADPKFDLPELKEFSEASLRQEAPSKLSDRERIHEMELRDVNQQITMRPIVAMFFAMLLFVQNFLLLELVAWALVANRLAELQLIFGVLIAGTLAQTYAISRFIVQKLFTDIDYDGKHKRF